MRYRRVSSRSARRRDLVSARRRRPRDARRTHTPAGCWRGTGGDHPGSSGQAGRCGPGGADERRAVISAALDASEPSDDGAAFLARAFLEPIVTLLAAVGDGTQAVLAPALGCTALLSSMARISSGMAHMPLPICACPCRPHSRHGSKRTSLVTRQSAMPGCV